MNSSALNRALRLLILCLISICFYLGSLTADLSAAETVGVREIPEGLQGCLSELSRQTMAEIPALKKEWGQDFMPEFTLQYYQKVTDFRNGVNSAWLIGYCVGQDSPHGNSYNRISIMAENKDLIFSSKDLVPLGFQEEEGYEAAALVVIAPNRYALAISRTVNKWEDGVVNVIALGSPARMIFTFPLNKDAHYACATSFYFADLNNDKQQAIIADSTFYKPEDGKEVSKKLSVFAINAQTKKYEPTTSFSQAIARSVIASRKKPDIAQFSRPMHSSDESR